VNSDYRIVRLSRTTGYADLQPKIQRKLYWNRALQAITFATPWAQHSPRRFVWFEGVENFLL
jgi:hypothetical protein